MAVNDLITFRKGPASQWISVNPVLASGEPGYDLTNSILKIGDGVSNWVALSGIGSTSVGGSSSSVGVRGVISTTGNLTSFAVSGGYPVGYLDLFQDGIKLVSDLDFSATDGSNVSLSNGVPSGTVLEYLTMASGVSSGSGSSSYDSRWDLFLPPAPTGLTVSAGNSQVTVSWAAPTVLSQTPITDYVVQYSSNSGSTWTIFSDGVSTSVSSIVTGLSNGTSYTFRVAAVNGIGQGAYSSSSAAVTPVAGNIIQTTSGLYAWYDTSADDTLYSASSGGSLVTTNGGTVNCIRDKSGNNLDLKNLFSGTPATLVTSGQNGKNFVLLDNRSGGVGLQTTQSRENGVFYCSNPLTIFAVWKPFYDSSALVDDVRYSWGDRESSTAVGLGLQSGRARMIAYSTSWIESGSGRTNNWICQRAVMNGTSSKLYVNGVYQAPLGGGNSTSDTPSGMTFSLPCGDWRTQGYHQLGEVVFYQGALSDSTAAAIDSYLMTKWGIS